MAEASCVINPSWDTHPHVRREYTVHEINAMEIDGEYLVNEIGHCLTLQSKASQ